MLRFNDGMSFDTSGPLRCVCQSDGWYVVGKGMMFAVASYTEGKAYIDAQNKVKP